MTKTLALIITILNNMFIFSEKSLTLFLIQAGAELGQVHYNIGYLGGGGQGFWIFEIFQSCFAWLETKKILVRVGGRWAGLYYEIKA